MRRPYVAWVAAASGLTLAATARAQTGGAQTATGGIPGELQHARVEVQAATTLPADVRRLAAAADPVWIGWQVPMMATESALCSTWSDGQTLVRGERLDHSATPPSFDPPSGAVALEAASTLVVLLRASANQIERLQPLSGDCPVDAGGRTVYWLTGVPPADSLGWLETLAGDAGAAGAASGTRRTAVTTIGLHRDDRANEVLDRLVASPDEGVRRAAATALAASRGVHGFEAVMALVRGEADVSRRRVWANALGLTRQPGTAAALLALARTDPDARIRSDAVSAYSRLSGPSGIPNVRAIIDADADATVKRRAVDSLAALPADATVPVLIDLARASRDLAVRKDAVSALGQVKDPRASAYLETLLQSR